MQRVLVSSCLLGDPVRYDGRAVPCDHPVMSRWRSEGRIVPCCPERLAGLPVPRSPVELSGGDGAAALDGRSRAIARTGEDLTKAFLAGTAAAVALCQRRHIRVAVLKDRSPSCGASMVHDGTFSGAVRPGQGMTTAALERAGVRVFTERQWEEASACLASLEALEAVMPAASQHRMDQLEECPMPRPPLLPLIDWKAVFESGLDHAAWLGQAEDPEHRQKMDALREALVLEPQTLGFLAALPRPVHVVAIAEDWCGDVVRHVPVLQRLAEAAPRLKVRYISRRQHPEVFVRFLTNGGEAIPKFIFLSEAWVECGNWGPMPEPCRALIARGKACGDVAAARKKVSALYDMDSNRRMVVAELVQLLDIASSREP